VNNNDHTDAQQQSEQSDDLTPWEEIEAGRFMPRRIRGSYRGRALG